MEHTLKPELQARIQRFVDSGRFEDTNAVLLAAFNKLEECERKLDTILANPQSVDPSLLAMLHDATTHSAPLFIVQHFSNGTKKVSGIDD